MIANVCRRQAARWLWRRRVCPAQTSRSFSTPSSEPQKVRAEPNPASLTDMGFSETQAEEIQTKSRGKDVTSVLSSLLFLGLNPSSVLKILEKCPELCSLRGAQLQHRIQNLRRLGLGEGSLQRVLSHQPKILLLPSKRVLAVSRVLREKCLFTFQQVSDILRFSPEVAGRDSAELEYQFQYAFFRMGVRQAEMVKAQLFRASLLELRCRHGFLERRGLYQTPDKKGQTLITNPPLKDFLLVSQETFLTAAHNATADEFRVFQKLMARECEEEEEEEEGSDDEEDEHHGRSAYKRNRKFKKTCA